MSSSYLVPNAKNDLVHGDRPGRRLLDGDQAWALRIVKSPRRMLAGAHAAGVPVDWVCTVRRLRCLAAAADLAGE